MEDQSKLVDEGNFGFSGWIEELSTVTFDKVMKLTWPTDVANIGEVAWTKNESGVSVRVTKDVVPLRTKVVVLFPKQSRNIFKKNKVNKSVQINEQHT